jgi:Glycosyl transferase family 2
MQAFIKGRPIVSIGMPVFNSAETVGQAILSILIQTFEDWELLVIDDGSKDETAEIVASFHDPRIILMRGGENRRLPERLNQCASRARGKFFARMDGDDIAYPERLQCQLNFLQSHPGIDLLAGWAVVFRSDGTAIGALRGFPTHEQIGNPPWKGMRMPHSTWIGKIEWFRRNPYRIGAKAEDQDLLVRTYRGSRFATLQQVVMGYREDRLSLPYCLSLRWDFCKSNVRTQIQHGRPKNAALCILSSAATGLAEVMAISTGLDYHILRRRAAPLCTEEQSRWSSVWDEVQTAAQCHHPFERRKILMTS